jgi:carboxyl-terminal processing protease
MHRLTCLWLTVVLLVVSCSDATRPPSVAQAPSATTAVASADPGSSPTARVTATALVLEAITALLREYYDVLDPAQLFTEAWAWAAAALRAAGIESVPPLPAYPSDGAAAAALHQQHFPTLESLAAGRLGNDQLAHVALHALAVQRDDPHTSYRSPALVQRDAATRQGNAAVQLGLGFSRTKPPRVVPVPPGSPAEQAGLQFGEVILAVNGVAVTNGADIPALVDVRVGVPNSFTVQDASGRTAERTVVPAAYVRPIEVHDVIEGQIGVLRLYGFPATDTVVHRLRDTLLEFERQGVEGWVLDLRDNGGGPVETVVAVAGLFVEPGPLFAEERRGRTLTVAAAEGGRLLAQRPLVVLVGPGSFSGGEILPAVLQAQGRAIVLGEPTGGGFGSSTSVALTDGSAFNITATEVVVEPTKQRLNHKGLTPDVVVPRTAADVAAGRDPQLAAAAQILRDRLTGP